MGVFAGAAKRWWRPAGTAAVGRLPLVSKFWEETLEIFQNLGGIPNPQEIHFKKADYQLKIET